MRIGIFGGSFNPPHLGHIRAANSAADALGLDKLLLIPAYQVPHKQMDASAPTPQQRLEMVTIAARGNHKIGVSDLEIRRQGKSYTWDTICALHQQEPEAELILLLGSDMFCCFHNWLHASEIMNEVELAVLSRGEKEESEQIARAKAHLCAQGARVTVLHNPVTEISSTQLRRLLSFGCGEEFLPDGLPAYIREHRLYNTEANWKQLPMEQLEQVVISLLDPKRVSHVLGCRDTCVELAKRWGANGTDAARAGLLHDITKALDGPLQLTLCRSYGKILDDFSIKYPQTHHAFTGSLVAERIFGENENVVAAIASHTTGKSNMSPLEMIVYVADYMEPNRDFPGVERLRELAFNDLPGAVKLGLEMTLARHPGSSAAPQSVAALEYLNQSL